MSKFIKGPWSIIEGTFRTPYIVSLDEGFKVATVPLIKGFYEEINANAHLISAAPEMYEAIEKTLLALDGLIKIDTKNELKEARILMIEALAKARGGE